jgi:hypothetical protein
MKPTPKTIQIYLPGGDPRGIRIAEITTRIVQVIEVPRSLLGEFAQMPQSNQVALYFLFGESDENEPRVYIGQTGDLQGRLTTHNREKDFWERALVVISRTNSLTQTHAIFLEWFCLDQCRSVGRYADANENSASRPHTPEPLEADCLEIFDTARVLLATLGFPLFEPVAKTVSVAEDAVYHCKGSDADGRGLYTPEGFVVMKGSSGRTENVPSMAEHWRKFRLNLLHTGVVVEKNGRYVFTKDHLFTSPTAAAVSVMGRPASGWMEWRDQMGRTLDDVYRKKSDSSS